MDPTVTPEAAELLDLMLNETRVPDGWETSGFWLDSAQNLAQFMVEQRGKICLEDASMLLAIGGLLVEMAKRDGKRSHHRRVDGELGEAAVSERACETESG